MLIEFFGLPGSGKSTMSRMSADLLEARGLTVEEVTFELDHRRKAHRRILTKLVHILRFAARYPVRAIGDGIVVASSGQATWKDGCKALFNWLFIASIAARKRAASQIVMLDQGVAQALWSVRFAARRDAGLDAMLRRARRAALLPDLVVHVRTDLHVVGDRLSARAGRVSRLDAQGRDLQALRHSESQADALIHRLRSSGISVIDLPSEDPGDLVTGARCIADTIMARLNQRNQHLRARQEPFTGTAEMAPVPLKAGDAGSFGHMSTTKGGGALE
jgi:thymidylate kinase